ncbi:MAG: exodeoxyribonuclease VII small subunit [Coriobacteriia bacterium]|nr:exodeoxyribonuclease VII small subunit [Coriobacteriia bacterium]
MKFNEQLTQLEAIVTQLEGGQLDLEDSLKRYEEGVQLIRSLQEKLASAEQKVQLMMGEIHEQD